MTTDAADGGAEAFVEEVGRRLAARTADLALIDEAADAVATWAGEREADPERDNRVLARVLERAGVDVEVVEGRVFHPYDDRVRWTNWVRFDFGSLDPPGGGTFVVDVHPPVEWNLPGRMREWLDARVSPQGTVIGSPGKGLFELYLPYGDAD